MLDGSLGSLERLNADKRNAPEHFGAKSGVEGTSRPHRLVPKCGATNIPDKSRQDLECSREALFSKCLWVYCTET